MQIFTDGALQRIKKNGSKKKAFPIKNQKGKFYTN